MNATTNAATVRMRKTAASDTTTGVDGPPTTNEGSGSDSGSEVTLPPEQRTLSIKVLFYDTGCASENGKKRMLDFTQL